MSCDPSVWGSQEAHWSPQRSSQRRVFSPNAHRSQEGRKWVKEMERTRVPGEDQLHLSGVVEKKEALFMTYFHVYKMEKKTQICPTNMCIYVHTCLHISEHMNCVEDCTWGWGHRCSLDGGVDVPVSRQEAWSCPREEIRTCEMIIDLLYVNYTGE